MSEELEVKKSVYALLKSGQFSEAEQRILSAMETDLHNPDYEELLKICKFWENRSDCFQYRDSAGEKLYNEWDKFWEFCDAQNIRTRKGILAVKGFVFNRMIDFLIDGYRLSPVPERETLILLGEALAEVGMVDRAIETLEYAMSIVMDDEDVRIYMMLGNLYAETGEKDLAMAMFSEAFLKCPQLVNLDQIEYPPVQRLKEMVEADGFCDNEILEWIPVYGYLFEGLTVRRRLSYKDFMELKERVVDYENSLKVDKKAQKVILPRLINYYFWVLDYYLYQAKTGGPADNVIKRIMELIGRASMPEGVHDKLSSRASMLLKGLAKKARERNEAEESVKV